MTKIARAAPLHEIGGRFSVDGVAPPKPGSLDVLVDVKATSVAPSQCNLLAHYSERFPLTNVVTIYD